MKKISLSALKAAVQTVSSAPKSLLREDLRQEILKWLEELEKLS